MSKEQDIWFGTPSQVTNLASFIPLGFVSIPFLALASVPESEGAAEGAVLVVVAALPLFIMLWKWLEVKTTQHELTIERIRTRRGILNRTTDEIELYRVRDYKVDRPFFLRLFSLGNIILETSDRSHPTMILKAIPNCEHIREKLRTYVEECRTKKRVREVDFT